MTALSWSQVSSWRISQQYLRERADRTALCEVAPRVGGVQAQLTSANVLSETPIIREQPADAVAERSYIQDVDNGRTVYTSCTRRRIRHLV